MSQNALPESIREIIVAKCGSVVSLTLAWERSVLKALASGASEEAIATLAKGFASPRTLDALLQGVVGYSGGIDGFLSQLRDLVDDSAFDFASWLGAFEMVESHLIKAGRTASAGSIVGYVQCSAEFGGGAENHESLVEIIGGMLSQYGFEGQEGCGTAPAG